MSSSPQSRPPWRCPRAHLDGNNPIVLRFPNGQRIGANLQVISVTGGLLSLSKSVDQGSRVRLMFLTEAGSVLGAAQRAGLLAVQARWSDWPAHDRFSNCGGIPAALRLAQVDCI